MDFEILFIFVLRLVTFLFAITCTENNFYLFFFYEYMGHAFNNGDVPVLLFQDLTMVQTQNTIKFNLIM